MVNTATTGQTSADNPKPDDGDEDDGGDTKKFTSEDDEKDSRATIARQESKDSQARTTQATPGRSRKLEPPPMPRRADFGDHYPDGGWGWVVCGAAFVVNFLTYGTHLAFGSLLSDVLATFRTSKLETVWLGSGGYGISLFMCPMMLAVCRRKSPRLWSVIGGLVTALGCLFLSFSVQLHQLYISYLVVFAAGTGTTMTTSGILVGKYFHKRREAAEMIVLTGAGCGMAFVSVFIKHVTLGLSWMRSMQAMAGLMLPTVLAGALFRSSNLYHPRRKAILHIKSLRKSKKQRRDFEDKPPYFDWAPLRMRGLQMLMLSSAFSSIGGFVPFALVSEEALGEEMTDTEVSLLMVFLGLSFACGSLLFGAIVMRSSLRCLIARQYLCQLTGAGCGLFTLLLPIASGFNAFTLYVCGYGLLYGGFIYTLKMYTYETVSFKLSDRSWGYICLAQVLPTIIGAPIAVVLNVEIVTMSRSGFLFAGVALMLGAALLFLMPWACKHHSNHEVIQGAHFKSKTFQDDMLLYGMEVSDDTLSKGVNNFPFVYNTVPQKDKEGGSLPNKIKLYPEVKKHSLCNITEAEEGNWPDIEAMSPMSAADKVKEFLMQSQAMLQSYGQLHNMTFPGVRLEINKEYVEKSDETADSGSEEIMDLKLQATIYRNSNNKTKDSHYDCGTAIEMTTKIATSGMSPHSSNHSSLPDTSSCIPQTSTHTSPTDSKKSTSPETQRSKEDQDTTAV